MLVPTFTFFLLLKRLVPTFTFFSSSKKAGSWAQHWGAGQHVLQPSRNSRFSQWRPTFHSIVYRTYQSQSVCLGDQWSLTIQNCLCKVDNLQNSWLLFLSRSSWTAPGRRFWWILQNRGTCFPFTGWMIYTMTSLYYISLSLGFGNIDDKHPQSGHLYVWCKGLGSGWN